MTPTVVRSVKFSMKSPPVTLSRRSSLILRELASSRRPFHSTARSKISTGSRSERTTPELDTSTASRSSGYKLLIAMTMSRSFQPTVRSSYMKVCVCLECMTGVVVCLHAAPCATTSHPFQPTVRSSYTKVCNFMAKIKIPHQTKCNFSTTV